MPTKTDKYMSTADKIASTTFSILILIGLLIAGLIPPEVPPCPTEDSVGLCHWDASKQGNGEGQSFTVYPDGTIKFDK